MSDHITHPGTMVEIGLPSVVRLALQTVRAHLDTVRSRRRLRDELSRCSDRELADMGLSRGDIRGIAAGIPHH